MPRISLALALLIDVWVGLAALACAANVAWSLWTVIERHLSV